MRVMVMMMVLSAARFITRAFHFHLHGLLGGMAEFQRERETAASGERLFEADQHHVVAAWLELGALVGGQRQALRHGLHAHIAAGHHVFVDFHAFGHGAAAADQRVGGAAV